MSTKKELFNTLINSIKEKLGFDEVPGAGDQSPAMELKEYTTDTGTVVNIDRLEVGGKVTHPDGSPVAGNITLQDGTMVSIDGEGNITGVESPVPVEATEQQETPPAPLAMSEEVKEKFAAQEQSFKSMLQTEQEARKADAQKFSGVVTQLLDLMQKFAEQPSEDPIQKPATGVTAPSKKERGAALLNAAKAAATAKAL